MARRWAEAGGEVLAFTRTPRRHGHLAACGAEPRLGSPVGELRVADRLLLSLPGTAAQAAAVAELASVAPPARTVLISSTGFHAGAAGWVDEASPRGPGERAAPIAECERAFAAWAGRDGVILRCGGLYRAGRGPLSALRRGGEVPFGPPDTTLALIHYDDAATAAFAALRHPAPAPVYLCVTPPSPARREFWEEACRALGAPAPRFEAPTGSPPMRYDVTRLVRDLLPEPQHPDWRDAARA